MIITRGYRGCSAPADSGRQGKHEFKSFVSGCYTDAEHAFAFGQTVKQSTGWDLYGAGAVALEPALDLETVECGCTGPDTEQNARLAVRRLLAINPQEVTGRKITWSGVQAD